MSLVPFLRKSLAPPKGAIKQNKKYFGDRDYFQPDGIHTLYGEQGSSKTLTAVHILRRIKKRYPKALLCSNIVHKDMKALKFDSNPEKLLKILENPKLDPSIHYIYYDTIESYEMVYKYVRRGKFGRIILTDEIQNYFSNQDSKHVPMWVIQQAAQHRKQRTLALFTSQDYDQIAKPIRRRTISAIKCSSYAFPFTHGSILTIYWLYNAKRIDFDNAGIQTGDRPKKIGWYWHNAEERDSYDTLQVIFSGKDGHDIYEQRATEISQKLQIVVKKK